MARGPDAGNLGAPWCRASLVALRQRVYVLAMAGDTQPLTGMLLVAMPGMPDPRFAHSVIYLCAHSPEGAMGLIVNRRAEDVTFPAVVDQLGITPTPGCNDTPVHVGRPVG